MTLGTALAIGLAALSATLQNLAYLRQHDAAASLPTLSLRRPRESVTLLLRSRAWLRGFAMETSGFLAYAAALALASLALVQSIAAGGIGVLAYVSSRMSGRPLGTRRVIGVLVSVIGLLALGVSLARDSGERGTGSILWAIVWVLATGAAAGAVLATARGDGEGLGVRDGIAGGLLFSIGDLSTKLATTGGVRAAFVITLILGYLFGTSLLQLGYQRSAALTVAGPATLLTNALPIAAGTVVLNEPIPSGVFGVLRVLAFVAVTVGAILLTASDRRAAAPRAPAV